MKTCTKCWAGKDKSHIASALTVPNLVGEARPELNYFSVI